MMRKLLSLSLIGTACALGAFTIRSYGEYKYYCGRCDSNELNGIIIDSQHKLIHDLCDKLKEKEEES